MFSSRTITVITGDSTITVTSFFKTVVGKNTTFYCDFVFIDGGPPHARIADLENFRFVSNYKPKRKIQPSSNITLNSETGACYEIPVNKNEDEDESFIFTNVLVVDDLEEGELHSYFEKQVLEGTL